MLAELEENILGILKSNQHSAEKMLRDVLMAITDACENNKKLFSVLLNYLMQLKKSGVDTNERVRRRVIKLRHVLSTVLIKGIRNDEFREINVKDVNEILYSMIEASIFRIAVLNQDNISEIRQSLNTAVDSILNK